MTDALSSHDDKECVHCHNDKHVPKLYSFDNNLDLGLINPRRACARVTVLGLSLCVCVFPILAPRANRRTNSSISDFNAIRAWNIKGIFLKYASFRSYGVICLP